MKTYIVQNPCAFIGYFIVKAVSPSDALAKAERYISKNYSLVSPGDDLGFAQPVELKFDKDGLNALLEGLE